MVSYIGPILIYTAVAYFLMRFLRTIETRDASATLIISVLLSLITLGLGLGLRYSLDLATFFITAFFLRVFFIAGILFLLQRVFSGFRLKGVFPAVVVGLALAITGLAFDALRQQDYITDDDERPYFQQEGRDRNGNQ